MTVATTYRNGELPLLSRYRSGQPGGRNRVSLVLVTHVLPTSIPFIRALSEDFELKTVVAIPYSYSSAARAEIPQLRVIIPANTSELERELLALVQAEDSLGNPFVVQEIGGHLAPVLAAGHTFEHLIGIVEDTRQGHWRYRDKGGLYLNQVGPVRPRDFWVKREATSGSRSGYPTVGCVLALFPTAGPGRPLRELVGALPELDGYPSRDIAHALHVPVMSVAESPLKALEHHQIGRAIVFSLERQVRRHFYRSLSGEFVAVVGFGDIGSAAARALQGRMAHVLVHDVDPVRQASAWLEGFRVGSLAECIATSNVILGCSGSRSLTSDVLRHAPDGAVFASGSSKQVEIDVDFFLRPGSEIEADGELTASYQAGRRHFLLLGYPSNSGSAPTSSRRGRPGPAVGKRARTHPTVG